MALSGANNVWSLSVPTIALMPLAKCHGVRRATQESMFRSIHANRTETTRRVRIHVAMTSRSPISDIMVSTLRKTQIPCMVRLCVVNTYIGVQLRHKLPQEIGV